MASDVLDVVKGLGRAAGNPIIRRAGKTRTTTIGTGRLASWSWISLAIVVAGACLLSPEFLNGAARVDSSGPITTTSLPTSLYFQGEHAAIDAEGLETIAAIARAVNGNVIPIVVSAYSGALDSQDWNPRLLQKQAVSVRNALIAAGVPRLRIVVVAPTFTNSTDARRVEVALVHGVPAFPAQPTARMQ